MPYSQYGEDDTVLQIFAQRGLHHGRFLDIGAYDGKTFSNTLAFVERGWGGVLVEPSPTPLKALLERYRDSLNVTIVNAVIAAQGGRELVKLYDAMGDGLSTTEPSHVKRWRAAVERVGNGFSPFWTMQLPVWELVTVFPGPYQLVSIDTEGTSAAIWHAMPDEALTETMAAIVEHDGETDKIKWIEQRGRDRGFQAVVVNGTNTIMVRE
jgi:FkbM family methyltransferase